MTFLCLILTSYRIMSAKITHRYRRNNWNRVYCARLHVRLFCLVCVVVVRKSRKLSRRHRASLQNTQTPEICIDELKDESEDGYASDSTSDSASELDYADTEDTTSRQPSPPTHLHGMTPRHPRANYKIQTVILQGFGPQFGN